MLSVLKVLSHHTLTTGLLTSMFAVLFLIVVWMFLYCGLFLLVLM